MANEEDDMTRVVSVACVLILGLVVSISAQAPTAGQKIATDADYAVHMKEIGQLNGVLTKAVKGGVADEASKAAARMEVLFKNVHAYWVEKKVTDAIGFTETALTGLQAVQKATAANDMAAAETARASVAGACQACHMAHREKLPEGGFRIK
jgi:hypothetical protein